MLPALASVLPDGRIDGLADLWTLANQTIWKGASDNPTGGLGFWHVVSFAWICNLAMHVGLSDMALFRFAPRASYGLFSAFGMYLGHYLAWITAGVMGAGAAFVAARPLATLDSGDIASQALGVAGALAVVVAGWTTANPTLYRAGLALQVVSPNWPRWKVTLIAGIVTTLMACSPFVFTRLLDFVGVYGVLLMPVGAIVFVEHWIFPALGFTQFWASRRGLTVSWPALGAWFLAVGLGAWLWLGGVLHLFFLAVPVWLTTAVLYVAFAALAGAREPTAGLAGVEAAPEAPAAASPRLGPRTAGGTAAGLVALGALAACLLLPLWVYQAGASEWAGRLASFKGLVLAATAVYFVAGVTWMREEGRRRPMSSPR
jgi:NCS1 family nucleobase:cation symporter-1